MNSERFYLRQNVQLEPLVNQWYAWPHLVAPATAAMNIANSHVKIMKSYIMAPQVHAAAVKNPAMRGGPFLDLDGNRVNDIKRLLDITLKEQACMIELAKSIKELNELVLNEAKGYSLEGLYEKIPENLRGYTELTYDINNNSSIRFIEALLYRSRYYDKSHQSLALSLARQDGRSFVFSTPRLNDEGLLHLPIVFDDPAIDELFKMHSMRQPFGYIKEMLGIEEGDETLFRSFLTEEAPPAAEVYDNGSIRIRYFGHACIQLESNGITLLTDPVISYKYDGAVPRLTYADLPSSIDYVLLTHTHSDHVVFETLLQLRHRIKTIIVPRSGGGALEDPSLKLVLKNIGFKNVVELDEMESLEIEGGSITGIPFLGEHGDLVIRSKMAHLIRLGNKTVMCAADSCNLDTRLYKHVHDITGDIDVLFLGMECDGAPMSWLYGALLMRPLERKMDHSRRLCGSDCERGMAIIDELNCKQVYVYAMGQEPWLSFLTSIKYTDESKPIVESNKLLEACRNRGIGAERLYGMKEMLV